MSLAHRRYRFCFPFYHFVTVMHPSIWLWLYVNQKHFVCLNVRACVRVFYTQKQLFLHQFMPFFSLFNFEKKERSSILKDLFACCVSDSEQIWTQMLIVVYTHPIQKHTRTRSHIQMRKSENMGVESINLQSMGEKGCLAKAVYGYLCFLFIYFSKARFARLV